MVANPMVPTPRDIFRRRLIVSGLRGQNGRHVGAILYSHFLRLGCLQVEVRCNSDGEASGSGFIEFYDQASVDDALACDLPSIDGQQLAIRRCTGRLPPLEESSDSEQSQEEEPAKPGRWSEYDERKLFVGGLPRSATCVAVRKYFAKFGDVRRAYVSNDKNNGGCRGFGFIHYCDVEGAERCLAEYDGHEIYGRWVEVRRLPPPGPGEAEQKSAKQKMLFVGGLPWTADKETLQTYFGRFGTLSHCSVKTNPITGKSRGFGFIEFANPEHSREVLKKKRDHRIDGKWIDVQSMVRRTPQIFPKEWMAAPEKNQKALKDGSARENAGSLSASSSPERVVNSGDFSSRSASSSPERVASNAVVGGCIKQRTTRTEVRDSTMADWSARRTTASSGRKQKNITIELEEEIEDFLEENEIDEKVANDLRQVDTEVQRLILEEGNIKNARNPSGVLVSRIKTAKAKVGTRSSRDSEVMSAQTQRQPRSENQRCGTSRSLGIRTTSRSAPY